MASSLLTTLVICTILSMFVMYYLSLIDQQTYLNGRSQVWNMAIAISEAGIEDGMAEINTSSTYPTLSGDGWSGSNMVFSRTNSLPDGNSYVVTVITTNTFQPAVVCRATVYSIPKYGRNASSSFFAAIGASAQTQGGSTNRIVTRAVSVICKKDNLFTAALAAKRGIDLKGNGVYTDSFNSNMPGIRSDYNGMYNSSIYSGDRGDIGTNGGITNNGLVTVQNANVYGLIHTGPNCPVSIGANGGVGPHCCQAFTVAAALAAGYIRQDANFTYPDTSYPNTAGYWTPPSGYLAYSSNWVIAYTTNTATPPNPPPPGGVTPVCSATVLHSPLPPLMPCCSITTNDNSGVKEYDYVPITGYNWTFAVTNSVGYTNYYDHIVYGNGCPTLGGDGSLTNPYTMCPIPNSGTNNFIAASLNGKTAVIGTNTVLALPNGLTGSESFSIQQNSAVLLYAGNNSVTSCSISGSGYVNANGHATSFMVFCPPSVTSFSFTGNGQFTGVFIAPNADMNLSGSGSSNEDFSGALMMNSVTLNGHFSFHWDEGLQDVNFNGRFLVQTWNEVK